MSLQQVWKAGGNLRALVQEPRRSFGEVECDGDPLVGTVSKSFPPLQAVCLFGPQKVADLLAEAGLARHRYDELPPKVSDAYWKVYEEEGGHPAWADADVVVAGWPGWLAGGRLLLPA